MEITTQQYILPDDNSQGYTVYLAVIGALKRVFPELNTVSLYPQSDEKELTRLGVLTLNGKLSSTIYANKFIRATEKIIGRRIQGEEKDYVLRKIKGYVKRDMIKDQTKKISKLIENLEELVCSKIVLLD